MTGYSLVRHVGEGPTIIHGLVGIAIAAVMNKQLETWVQSPGSSNLYWALTDLPVSFIDLRKCMQGERLMIDNMMPKLRDCVKDKNHPPLSVPEMRESCGLIARSPRCEPWKPCGCTPRPTRANCRRPSRHGSKRMDEAWRLDAGRE
ncbi:hypothetical protein BH11PLA2_BH11PLA2_23080 [soil metagenome]